MFHAQSSPFAESDPDTIRLSRPRSESVRLKPGNPGCETPTVQLTDPAVLLMTDFRCEPPITTGEDRSIDDALGDMIRFGVRALLVVRDEAITGLITSYDIQGERPLQFLQNSTFTRHSEIAVAHIMTPWKEVPMLGWLVLERARVRDVVRVFQGLGATHLAVVETEKEGPTTVRGLISKTRTERQLGL